jgi:hypothetical protein
MAKQVKATRKRRYAARKAWHTQRTVYKKRGHRTWTRKSIVKLVYDQIGKGAAEKVGRHLELKETTLRTWFSGWR